MPIEVAAAFRLKDTNLKHGPLGGEACAVDPPQHLSGASIQRARLWRLEFRLFPCAKGPVESLDRVFVKGSGGCALDGEADGRAFEAMLWFSDVAKL